MKASFSFALALSMCASTTLLASSLSDNKLRSEGFTESGARLDAPAVASFRLPAGVRPSAPHAQSPTHICLNCALLPIVGEVPASAIEAAEIQALVDWSATQDAAGTGSASGTTALVNTPALSGDARLFETSYANGGSERFYTTFGADEQATHFLYDGWLYIAAPSNDVANLEMDMNQVMANGQTVIFGVQCDGYSNTWDYTANEGTPEDPNDVWLHSNAPCNPREWATDVWHHVQIGYSRDDEGNVTYESVSVDGTEQSINVTVPSAFALGWNSVLLTNFQVDGLGASGSTMVYLDNLSIYRW